MAISVQEHSNLLTKKIVGKFEETIPVRSGFAGWFPEETTPSYEVDVEVQRGSDFIAVDVVRFTEGSKTKSSKVSEKKYIPPYFKLDYDFQRDSVYMNNIAFGVGMENAQINRLIAMNAVKGVSLNRDMIIRAIRKQQADVLQTGIVTLNNGDNIDYKRLPSSMVNVSTGGVYWGTAATATPITDIRKGMDFLRNIGNSGGASVNVVMRSKALEALLATTQVKEQGTNVIQQIQRINISMPQFEGVSGFAFHGQIAAGDFTVNLWTYNEKYTDANTNTTQYYLAENLVVMIPDDFQGKTIFGALPTMNKTTVAGVATEIPGIVEANYLIRSYSDNKTMSSTLELTSAPLVVPFTIDKIYTMQVFA